MGFRIFNFLMALNDPEEISEEDQRQLLGIEEGKTIKRLSIFSGELFQKALENQKERANWPENYGLALLVKCMSLEKSDKNCHSHPFKIIVGQSEINLVNLYDFDQRKKEEETPIGSLSYGNLNIGKLSMNHYYLLFFQLKRSPPPGAIKKDADWFCVGACDLTPNGEKMDKFDEFQSKYGDYFGKGALDIVLDHNAFARRLIPIEPLKSQSQIEALDECLKEPKKKLKKEKLEPFPQRSSQQRDVESEEENAEFQRAISDDEGETFWTSPSKRSQMEVEAEEEKEEEEKQREQGQKQRNTKRQKKTVIGPKKVSEKNEIEDEEKDCIASRTRANRSGRQSNLQRKEREIPQCIKKQRQQ